MSEKTAWRTDALNHETEIEWTDSSGGSNRFSAVVGQLLVESPRPKELPEGIDKDDCARMGFTAYLAEPRDNSRPLTFCYNGGPGSSSLWLHLGALGPKVASNLGLEQQKPDTPAKLVDNPHSLLKYTDLVFIDPIGTGFSEVSDEKVEATFFTEAADAESVSQFINRFVTKYGCWQRPIQILGESYGGYRSAKVADCLTSNFGIYPRNIALIAPYLSLASIEETSEQLIARANFLVTYAVTAWFHGRSSISADNAAEAYKVANEFVTKELFPGLLVGGIGTLSEDLVGKLGAMIGIDPSVLREFGDDFSIAQFTDHLFAGETRYPGRMDSRICMSHPLVLSPNYIDPALLPLEGRMTPVINTLFRDCFGLETDLRYCQFSLAVHDKWRFEGRRSALPELSAVMKKNPGMQLYCASGYFDMAVTVRGVEHDLAFLNLSEELQKNIHHERFDAGHMMYIEDDIRADLVKSLGQHLGN